MKLTESHYSMLRKLNNRSLEVRQMTLLSHSHSSDIHIERWLNDLQKQGLAVYIEPLWHITNAGREQFAKYTNGVAEIFNKRGKKKVYDQEIYEGFDPSKEVYRKGSLDFLLCPSLAFNERVYKDTYLARVARRELV